MKERIKEQVKNNITIDKRKIIFSIIFCIVLVLGCKLIPRNFSIRETYIKYLIIFDLILCILLPIHINFSKKWEGYISFGMLLIMPGVSLFNTEFVNYNIVSDMKFLVVVLNYLIYLSVYLLVYFMSNHVSVSISAAMSFFTICALINGYVVEFRGNAVRMTDVFAVGTALNVVEGYSLVFNQRKICIILLTIGVILFMTHFHYKEEKIQIKIMQRIGIAGIWVCIYSLIFSKTFLEEHELKPYIWELEASAKDHGVMLDFASGIPYLSVEKPEGYSMMETKQILNESVGNTYSGLKVESELQGIKPDIVVVMNESFADLSRLGNLETTESYLENFYALEENVIRGELSVPVFGGMTANTEFEFLTGYSNAFFPMGIIPFQNYVKKGTANLGAELEKEGYHTIFMHPMDKDGWNRDNVYSLFGFDQEHYIEDYTNNEYIRNYVSDSSNYKEVIERYEEAKKENEQVFLFNVTMQNHGGYETNAIEKKVQILQPEGAYPKAEEYLNLVRESDQAFQELIEYFSTRENPVIVCMFGDHLPAVEAELIDELLFSSSYSEVEKKAAKLQTPFVIYTNYDIEEKTYEHLSVNYLQVLLSHVAGLPLNEYQKYLESLYEKYPVINEFGVQDKDGEWYTWIEAKEFVDIKNYEKVQYMELFDK